MAGDDIQIIEARTGEEGLKLVANQYLDGIAVTAKLPDLSVARFVQQVQGHVAPYTPPILIFGREPLSDSQMREMRRLSRQCPVRLAPTPERFLDESVLLLHRVEDRLSDNQRETLARVREQDTVLANRKLLVVDDDIRNIFALTSVLEEHRLTVLHAEDGHSGIEELQRHPEIDAVIMDIMMPEMDGYETMRAIRKLEIFQSLPIIAVTAKAMKGDREKCLKAGASDYIAKPVDLEQLLSVLRVWILRKDDMTELSAFS